MANATIPSLPLAVALDGTEQIEIVQNGTSMRATIAQIVFIATSAAYVNKSVISNRQMRSALSALGLLTTVDNAVSADINNVVANQWKNGSVVVSNDALASFIATTIAYTPAQMVTLFASALTFPI